MKLFKDILLENFKKANAYWISPSGEIFDVSTTHIDKIARHPKKFRLTKDEILKIYDKHDEKPFVEGDAREEIMTQLTKKGWIRVRLNRKSNVYTLEFWKESNKTNDYIFDFANALIVKNIVGKHAGLRLLNMSKKIANTYDIQEILSFKIFECGFKNKLTYIGM